MHSFDDGELRPSHCIYVYPIDSRLIMELSQELFASLSADADACAIISAEARARAQVILSLP